MHSRRHGRRSPSWHTRIVALAAIMSGSGHTAWLSAAPVNPAVYSAAFDKAKADAEVVAEVRVVTVVCTDAKKEGDKVSSVTLQVALQVLSAEKGPVKKNEVVVVSRNVTLPSGPGPGMYGYWGQTHQFPFTPGVKGSVALRWDKDARGYVAIAGWVPEPNNDASDIPTEVGKAMAAKDK